MSAIHAEALQYMLVIPAYNEAATIHELLEQVLAQKPKQLLLINDASNDDTGKIVDNFINSHSTQPVKVIHNTENLGKAASLWLAFEQAIAQGMDVVITMDGDGQHPAEDIPALLKSHLEQPEHIIIGARERNLKNQPIGRFLANRFANFWISWAAGYSVSDSQSGFRLYPVSLLKKIPCLKNSPGFVFESEVIIEAAWQGYYTSIVNIPSIYHKNRRPSHFQAWQDIKKITKMVAARLVITRFNLKDLWAVLSKKPAPINNE
ncbi:glycosyltransferase family 2 protein [sulfur-oxidizing endosymbiont of Gigantopelta aegis]|uniref:glycosyltransferase family 2 protein n=1 Tax=sulfur-oxidizing endosymbiont of Gigantopelta aegis TaxID=2794934 RepID=UPI0018DE816F|nr:glycosyltransferase family 2 protein [sulfur-oxidizing endosymbiont of Gigantopelta aegis]